MRVGHRHAARASLFAAIGCVFAASPALAENWKFGASAGATETYTSNVNYSISSLAEGDWVTSITGALQINGEGARLKLNGSIGATASFYAGQSENNSFAPSVNLSGTLEAIEKFAYVDAQASVSQTFLSPFGAQPGNLVNATQNRYTQQTYAVSPYIKGVFGSSNISYQLRNDNYWTVATSFGNSSANVPNTYSNALNGSMSSPVNPWGWTLEYSRFYYDNGVASGGNVGNLGTSASGPTRHNRYVACLPYQIDPQLQIAARIGYEGNQFPVQDSTGTHIRVRRAMESDDQDQRWRIRGTSVLWHFVFGAGQPPAAQCRAEREFCARHQQLSATRPGHSGGRHGPPVRRMPRSRREFRIPPSGRRRSTSSWRRSGLPPTLASPVNFYATSLTLQDTANVSLVLIGTRNSLGFSVFYVEE